MATVNYKGGWEVESLAEQPRVQVKFRTLTSVKEEGETDIPAAVSATCTCKCIENSPEKYTPNTVLISGTGTREVGRQSIAWNFIYNSDSVFMY